MPEQIEKIVDFSYCTTCEYFKQSEDEDPCFDCLMSPTNVYSRKPIHYKEAEE